MLSPLFAPLMNTNASCQTTISGRISLPLLADINCNKGRGLSRAYYVAVFAVDGSSLQNAKKICNCFNHYTRLFRRKYIYRIIRFQPKMNIIAHYFSCSSNVNFFDENVEILMTLQVIKKMALSFVKRDIKEDNTTEHFSSFCLTFVILPNVIRAKIQRKNSDCDT